MSAQSRYESSWDLAKLDYFEVRDGRLVLAEPDKWRSFDSHTHLALSYALPNQVDLSMEHDRSETYLQPERPLDLDVYANKNLWPSDLKTMTRDLTLLSMTGYGMRRTHTLPNLLRDMSDTGVTHSLLLPIDFPVLSHNAETYLRLTRGQDRIICFGSVHPYATDVARKLDWQKAAGAWGVKVHPAVQLLRPDHPKCMKLYQMCAERNLMVLWHCGPVGIEPPMGRRRCQLPYYEPPIAENPDVTFILGHSGALQMDMALGLANRYPNVWLDLSSQGLRNIRRILSDGPTDRLLPGSDWPFYHQSLHLAKILIATEGAESLRPQVLWDNAARLFGLA